MFMLAMPGTFPGTARLEETPTLGRCARCWTPTGAARFETVEGSARVVVHDNPRFGVREYCAQCGYETGLLIHTEG